MFAPQIIKIYLSVRVSEKFLLSPLLCRLLLFKQGHNHFDNFRFFMPPFSYITHSFRCASSSTRPQPLSHSGGVCDFTGREPAVTSSLCYVEEAHGTDAPQGGAQPVPRRQSTGTSSSPLCPTSEGPRAQSRSHFIPPVGNHPAILNDDEGDEAIWRSTPSPLPYPHPSRSRFPPVSHWNELIWLCECSGCHLRGTRHPPREQSFLKPEPAWHCLCLGAVHRGWSWSLPSCLCTALQPCQPCQALPAPQFLSRSVAT